MLNYDRRVRDLQSIADKHRAEAEAAKADATKLAQEKAELERLKLELETTQATIVKGAAQVAQETMARLQEAERRFLEQQAEARKANALMAHPELRDYAALIPATNDEAMLNQAIETLVSARQRDLDTLKTELAAQQPSTPPTPSPETVLSTYPRNQLPYQIPSASPARPPANGAGSTQTFNDQLDQKLKAAMATGDPREFERVMNELGQQAEAQLRQQAGMH